VVSVPKKTTYGGVSKVYGTTNATLKPQVLS